MIIVKQIELHFREGTSDKVYIARIVKDGSFFSVPCEYGRRGSALKPANKGTYATLSQANSAFEKVVLEKTRKGYLVFDSKISHASYSVESSPEPVISSTESKECGGDAREKALARLKASSVW